MRPTHKRTLNRMVLSAAALLCASSAFGQSADKAPAEAQPGIYVRFDAGWGVAGGARIKDKEPANNAICQDAACGVPGKLNEIGSGYVAGAGVGYRFTSMLRADATVTRRSGFALNDTDGARKTFKGNISAWTTMLNGYVDIPINFGRFQPYAGVGLGLSRTETGSVSVTNANGTSTTKGGVKYAPAWAIMLGTGINIFESLDLDLGYRYTGVGKIAVNGGITTDGPLAGSHYGGAKGNFTAHEFMTGIRYQF